MIYSILLTENAVYNCCSTIINRIPGLCIIVPSLLAYLVAVKLSRLAYFRFIIRLYMLRSQMLCVRTKIMPIMRITV